MPDEALLAGLRERLPDEFSRQLLDGALIAIGQKDNPVRAHQFAATLRQLIDHVLECLAPTADVMRCPWFNRKRERRSHSAATGTLYVPWGASRRIPQNAVEA
jgi:hypothetical protein